MNLNNISLPYPVLGINDDILPMLPEDAVIVDLRDDKCSYFFSIHLRFNNVDISKMIEEGLAEFSCEYDCARTMLRSCIKTAEPLFEIEIPRRDVNGRINFNCFVSVKKPIKNYSNRGFNDDYKGFSFNMEPGDILVAFPQIHYDADIKYDKLQAAGSFMQIRESDVHENVFFDVSGDKIEILLPPALYALYCNPQVKGASAIIHSSLVVNALTYALMSLDTSKIQENEETRLWVRTIVYRLKHEDEYSLDELDDIGNIPTLAQNLLRNPYLRLFNNILNTNSNPLSEDEYGTTENI